MIKTLLNNHWYITGYFIMMIFSAYIASISQNFSLFSYSIYDMNPIIGTLFLFLVFSFLSSIGGIIAYHAVVLVIAPRLWKIGTGFLAATILLQMLAYVQETKGFDPSPILSYLGMLVFLHLYVLIPLFLIVFFLAWFIKNLVEQRFDGFVRSIARTQSVLFSIIFLMFLLSLAQLPLSYQDITSQYDTEAWYYLHRGVPFQFAGAIRGDSDVSWPLLKSPNGTGTEWFDPEWFVVYSIPELTKEILFLLPFALVMGISLAHKGMRDMAKKIVIASIMGLTILLIWSFSGV
ncbi:hypothetical protein KBD81_03845 [Candidatus Woesebacteria bacterium]|nr:hypothetical protein [Candidatus Woesebacteria bacterium]